MIFKEPAATLNTYSVNNWLLEYGLIESIASKKFRQRHWNANIFLTIVFRACVFCTFLTRIGPKSPSMSCGHYCVTSCI